MTIELDEADLERLIEALDSHEYWQLSDESERHSGYVILPGDLSEEGEPVEDLDAENHDEIRACRALAERLQAIRAKLRQKRKEELARDKAELKGGA